MGDEFTVRFQGYRQTWCYLHSFCSLVAQVLYLGERMTHVTCFLYHQPGTGHRLQSPAHLCIPGRAILLPGPWCVATKHEEGPGVAYVGVACACVSSRVLG